MNVCRMKKLLVTIGLLTYNHEKYIADALEGLLSQEYEEIELIILDDASKDKTSLIISQYMKKLEEKFTRVVSIRNEKNCGNIPYNCNYMIKQSKGNLYYAISGDDILLPSGIRFLCEVFQNHPECTAIHANMISIHDTYSFGDKIDINNLVRKDKKSGFESNNLFYRLMYKNCILAPTVMLRKEIFDRYGYRDECIAFEDYEYWLRISQTEKFYYLNKPIVLYRKAETSMTNFKDVKRLQIAIKSDFQTKRKYIGKLSKSEETECWKEYLNYYSQLCTKNQYKEGLKQLENLKKEMNIKIEQWDTISERSFKKKQTDEVLRNLMKTKRVSNTLANYLKKQKIYDVAIYGYSESGIVLHKTLLNAGINIKYIIDRKGRMLDCTCPVYTIDNILPDIDAVIVVPTGLYKSVKLILEEKVNGNIFDLDEMLETFIF